MKAMTDANMISIFKYIYEELEERNRMPKLYMLDTQSSKAVKTYIKSEKVAIKLFEPYNHCINAGGQAVKTEKYTYSQYQLSYLLSMMHTSQ